MIRVIGKSTAIANATKPVIWEHLGNTYDCVYSPDDGGYYLQRHSDDAVSQVCRVACQLWEALDGDTITWAD
jgi:hypothetical protein